MHILTLTPFYPTAEDDASGCFIAESVSELKACGLRTSVIAVSPIHRRRSLTPAPKAPPVRWQRYWTLPGNTGLPFSGRCLYPALRERVRILHASSPVSVIHAHSALPGGHAAMLLARDLGIPFVVTVHGLDAFLTRQVHGWLGGRCRSIARDVYQAARRVICISRRVEEVIKQEMPGLANTVVVFNGVDPCLFTSLGSEESAMPVILSVGNLISTKGHNLLLRAIAALSQQFEVKCEIVGEGPERRALEALANKLGLRDRVNFLGRRGRSEVAIRMRQSTLFVLPSRYEGLGCVYLEAMSTERPAIGCRGQGIEEVIRHRENGWLVEPENLNELRAALETLLCDRELRKKMGYQARETILAGFTLRHQAEALLAVYRETLA